MRIAVAGASGFVGTALTRRLVAAGHDVAALSRSASSAIEGADVVAVDVGDEAAVERALTGVEAAYYLVHSMASGAEFVEQDRRLAQTFGRAAATAGVERIIYLGGLGSSSGPASEHLASRHEVGEALGVAGVPVVELRAAVVFGAGGISFEMLRYLTERLPFMVCPRWVRTRIQPIALADLLAYLEQSLAVPPRVYEIGGSTVTTYHELILEYAEVRGLRRRRIVDIPWLTPRLSSYWVDLVTPVDRSVSHALIESLVAEVVVTDAGPAAAAFDVDPMSVPDALRAALDEQDRAIQRSLFDRDDGLADGVYTVVGDLPVGPEARAAVADDLGRIGGRFRWYGAPVGWFLRVALGRLVGERLGRRRPSAGGELVEGALVDWWRVAHAGHGVLLLRSVGWFPGDAWLGYRLTDDGLRQTAAFRPRGVPGFLYWKLLVPVHHVAFARMSSRRLAKGVTSR